MDLKQCLAILSGRGVCEHGSHEHNQPHTSTASSKTTEPLGQVIDLLSSVPPSSGTSNDKVDKDNADQAAAALSTEARAQASVAKLREGLAGLDVQGLIRAFRQAQEERAQAYQRFDEGLNKVLASRAFAEYDGLCAEATAGFAALSNLVNAVEHCLGAAPHERKVLAGLLRRVQTEEKEKLSLTAALHLETFRLATAVAGTTPMGGVSDGEGGAGAGEMTERDGREEMLLREGIKALDVRIGEVKGRINEILEELRYEVEEE
ncbi:Hypothetical protein NocV09_02300930 [Nannochloropsis oceanica]